MENDHFKGKDALSHIAERQALGVINSKEVHGLEVPGHIHAGCDAARDTAAALLLFFILLNPLLPNPLKLLGVFALAWAVWKMGRSSWLGWGRLERLHRILAQERWEIQHNRAQEREELHVLYSAKGFEGDLLEKVVDVLMADESRLLKVMIEEEMGIQLENTEHPLKQGFGALLGSLAASAIILTSAYFFPVWGLQIAALFVVGFCGGLVAVKAENRFIDAMFWNVGIAVLAWGTLYFGLKLL